MSTLSQSAVTGADSFAIARGLLLEGAGLELAALDRALSTAMVRKLDYVDLYLQFTRYETWTVEDGIVKEGAYSVDQGIGVRAISGERTGFAYSDQLDEAALTDAVVAARGIARAKGGGAQKIAARVVSHRPLGLTVTWIHSADGRRGFGAPRCTARDGLEMSFERRSQT